MSQSSEQPHNPFSYSLSESRQMLQKERPYDDGDKLILDFIFTAQASIRNELRKSGGLDKAARERVFQSVKQKYGSLTPEERDAVEIAIGVYEKALSPVDVREGQEGGSIHRELEESFAERFQIKWYGESPQDHLIFAILFRVLKETKLEGAFFNDFDDYKPEDFRE